MDKFMRYTNIIVLIILINLFFSCKGKMEETNEKDNLIKEKIEPVEVSYPKCETLYEYIYFTSTVDPLQSVDIICESKGIIDNISHEPGDKVKKNETIATLNNSDLLLRKKEIEVMLKQNSVKYKKIKKMFESEITTQDEYDAVKNEKELLEIQLAQLDNELEKTRIKSTIKGTLVEKFVERGQYININAVLFKIMDLSEYEIIGNIPEKDSGKVKSGQQVNIYIPESENIIAQGKIKKIYPVIDELSGTLKIEIQVTDNMNRLKVGQFVKCYIIVDEHSDIVVVPKKSLVRSDNKVYVYKIDNDDSQTIARKIEVHTGYVSDDYAEIKEGININDLIVTSGQFNLQDTGFVKIINEK